MCLALVIVASAMLPTGAIAAGPVAPTRSAVPSPSSPPAATPLPSAPAIQLPITAGQVRPRHGGSGAGFAGPTGSGNGLLGRYYPNQNWAGPPTKTEIDPTVDYDWSGGHPVPSGDFSVAWVGTITIATAGSYTFGLDSDDGSTLAIGGVMVVNNGGPHPEQLVTNTVALTAGTFAIAVRYFECCGGPAVVHLEWTPPGGSGLVVVPQSVLSTAVGPTTGQLLGVGVTPWGSHPVIERAEPVDTATGDYANEVTDLAIAGRGLPLRFTRTYNSLVSAAGPLGPGWTHAYAVDLHDNGDGTVTLDAENGAQFTFTADAGGGYLAAPGGFGILTAVTGGGWSLVRPDGVTYRFDATGALLSEADRNGNTLSFAYTSGRLSSITDTVGRVVSLAYDGAGHLTSISDPIGRTVGYAYDASGRLATVTDLRGGTTSYTYDAAGRLATIVDQNGHTLVTNAYDPMSGRVSGQLDALGHATSFGWDAATGTSTMTDASGGVWTDVYTNGLLTSATDPLGHATSYTYDADFEPASVTDPDGHTTSLVYDGAGNLTSRTAPTPLSYVETFTYDAANDLLSHTDGRGHTTNCTYDAAGDLTATAYPDGSSSSATYDSHGSRLSSTDQRGKTTSYAYDAAGDLTAVTTPLGERTTMTYDGVGRVLTTVDPRGNVTGANPAQYTTTYAYDAADHRTSITDQLGDVTTTAYDPAGNRTGVTDPNGHPTTFGYDAANHLTSVTDAAGKVTAYAYDAVGDLTGRTDANNHTTSYGYDLARRLTSTSDPASHTTTTAYDAAGNVTSRTDPNGHTTTYGYDALSRLTAITYASPSTPAVTFAYDANGDRTSMTDGAGTETFSYDALDRLTGDSRGTDAFGYTFDAAGNLLSRTYPDGTVTSYTYDDDGRLATASFPTVPPADTSPPSVPSGVAATASAWDAVTVSWTASSDNVGVTRYAIYRGGTLLAWVNGTTTSFVDRSTAGATAYAYTVVALDAAGNASGASSAANVTTPAGGGTDTTAPSVPSGLVATANGPNRVDLSWSASTDPAATISRVGGTSGVNSTAATTKTLSYASTAGDLLVIETSNPSTTAVSSVTDSAGNSWTKASGASGVRSTVLSGELWYAANAAAVSSVTVTFGASVKSAVALEEFAGVATASPLDVSHVGSGASTSPASGATTAVAAGELVLGYTAYQSAATTYTPTAGYTALANAATSGSGNAGVADDWRTSVAGTQTDAPTIGTNTSWVDGIAVFKAQPIVATGVEGYRLTRNGTDLGTLVGTTSLADTGLSASTAYTYTVAAVDGAANASAASASAGATTAAAPPTSATVSYAYDAAGELLTATSPDGVTARSSYDRAGRLLEVANTEASGTLSRFTSAYDPAGNRTEQTTVVGTTWYAYDSLDRLTSACTGGTCVPTGANPLACLACTSGSIGRPAASISPNPSDTLTTYAYDPVGNRTALTTYLGTTTYAYDAADRLTSSSGPGATTYTYDPNGNETSAGSTTYAYDLADRMVSATVGATTQTYSYSGDGIRLSAATGSGTATTNFLVDRAATLPQIALERDGTGVVLRDSLYGAGRIGIETAGVPTYEHPDPLGSVTDLTSPSGASLAWTEDAAYGAVRSAGAVSGAPADPFGFTGQYLDSPTGLYYLRARQYDPTTGRFTAVDPVAAPTTDPYVAAYVYGANNPVRYADPSGRCLFVCALVGGVVGGVLGTIVYFARTPATNWSAGALAGQAVLGAATGAVIGFTGGVAALGIAEGTLSAGGASLLLGTAGYATGIGQTAGEKLLGHDVTATTFASNIVGGVTSAVIGGPASGSLIEDVLGWRALVSDTVSVASGIVAK